MTPDDVRYLVVHTAAYSGRNCDRDMIHRWHSGQGWAGIGYHYVIINDRHDSLADGTVQEGRDRSQTGAHVRGINDRSIGICCVGHGDQQPHTEAQRSSLIQLLSDLMDQCPQASVDGIIGHREVNDLVREGVLDSRHKTSKSCPGTMVDMDEIRNQVRAHRSRPPELPVDPGARRRAPSDAQIRKSLEVLFRISDSTFPNANDERMAFLLHPEVVSLMEEQDGD